MNVRLDSFDPEAWTGNLHRTEEQVGCNTGRQVEHHRHARYAWRDPLKNLQPFSANAWFEIAKASSIAAGVREIWHETVDDGFTHRHENDWNCVSRLLDSRQRGRGHRDQCVRR